MLRNYDLHYAYTPDGTQYREHSIVTLRAKDEAHARKNANAYLRKCLSSQEHGTLHIYMVNISMFR